MKKRRLLCLLVCLLWIGCAGIPEEPVPTNTPTNAPTGTPTNTPACTPTNVPISTPTNTPVPTLTNTPAPTETPTPAPTECLEEMITPTVALTLLDRKQEAGTSGNVWYIPCVAVEGLKYPALYAMGENVVVYSVDWDEEENGTMSLSVISLRDGSLRAKTEFPGDGLLDVKILEDKIAIADSASGEVTVYNGTLEIMETYLFEPDWESWYLNETADKIYKVMWDKGVTEITLATGEERAVLTEVADLYVQGSSEKELALTYEDLNKGRTACMMLDRRDGRLFETPYQHRSASEIYHVGDTWLFHDAAKWGVYNLYRFIDGNYRVDIFEEPYGAELMENGNLLCGGAYDMTMYAPDGTYISTCGLTDNDGYFCSDMVYSELWGGYFFTLACYDGTSKLMFWDADIPTTGEKLLMTEQKTEIPGGTSADAVLYERAAHMSETYGVDIRIADQCTLEYSHYRAIELTDTALLTKGLDALEKALAAYPEGFFEQLCYGQIERIQIELVHGLSYIGTEPRELATAAFAQEAGSYYLIVADVTVTGVSTFFHEFSHVIDKKLLWDARFREDALFSEETWRAFFPEEFRFAYSYAGIEEQFMKEEYFQYFVSNYGMTYPTEDRATLMEEAMSEHRVSYEIRPLLVERMEYYSACIRQCFDTTGWPEYTRWEGLQKNVEEN